MRARNARDGEAAVQAEPQDEYVSWRVLVRVLHCTHVQSEKTTRQEFLSACSSAERPLMVTDNCAPLQFGWQRTCI